MIFEKHVVDVELFFDQFLNQIDEGRKSLALKIRQTSLTILEIQHVMG